MAYKEGDPRSILAAPDAFYDAMHTGARQSDTPPRCLAPSSLRSGGGVPWG